MPDNDVERTCEPEADFSDLSIQCIDCDDMFVWTAGAQAFFRAKELVHEPKRCKKCKQAKDRRLEAIEKAKLNGQPASIKITATCASCSEKTTLPFYPSQGRPVYCYPCYQRSKAAAATTG